MNIKNAQLSVDKWINKYGLDILMNLRTWPNYIEEVGEVKE